MIHYPETTAPKIKKFLLLFMTISCSVIYLVYTAAFVPLYTYVSTDILFMGRWLPFVLRFLIELLDIAVFAIAYFSILYAVFRMNKKSVWVFPVLYLLLTLLRRAASLFAQYLSSGYIGEDDILSLVLYYVIETVQLLIVIAIIYYEYNKYNDYYTECKKLGVSLTNLLPLTKVYDKKNPILSCMLKLSVFISSIKIVTRIISDIYYGAPESIAEVLVMVANYLSDLLNGVIFYAIIWFLFSFIHKKETALSEKGQNGL